ncbi:MAG: hypothetical protein ACUVUC_09275 [Thermoguttaceae bacterium]
MTDFQNRLEKAIERGQRARQARARAEAERALSERELRRLHTRYRLELTEHIENCLREVPRHLPGFRFDPVVSDRGWGAAVSRDDLEPGRGRRPTAWFSRLEMLVRPVSESFVLELAAKATVRNKEYFNRTHYQPLAEVELSSFRELIDRWVVEFAELYAARS